MTRTTVRPRTRPALLAAAAIAASLALVAGPRAEAADAQAALTSFLSRVTVRHGVMHGSLVVLPIVVGDEPKAPAKGKPGDAAAAAPALVEAGAGVDWKLLKGSDVLVELSAGTAPEARVQLLPTGTLLIGGERERILLRPVPLRGDEKTVASSVVCDSRKVPAAPAADTGPGPIVPLEQRKLALRRQGEAVLSFVQQIQATLAELPMTTATVGEVLASGFVTDAVRTRMADLSRVPKSYGGTTVGHIAFFGFRPVEVIAYARPEDYQALGPAHLRSIAASHAFWTEAAGSAAAPAADAEVRRLVPEGLAVLQSIAHIEMGGVRGREDRCRWPLHGGGAESDERADGRRRDPFTVRFALDDDGRFACLEAIENSREAIYAPPLTEPGGRPADEPPSKMEGALTEEFLIRALQRIREQKEKRQRQKEAAGGGK